MSTTSIFFNQSFDKKRLKAFLDWILKTFGEEEALIVVEQLKSMGFYNATKAGLSIGLHDLKTPYKKPFLISHAQATMSKTDQEFQGAEITATERSQRVIDTWHRTSEDLRKQVVDYFSAYDQLNSVYMMALSGARGNFSQVRQLIGMRGLMADPQGQMIRFPIRSNLREGLTLTEYFISCSGARKGLVDTALRTADTGYLTRRLVDISHHIVVKKVTCYTPRGIVLKTLRTSQKTLLPLRDRLIGRVLAEDIYDYSDSKRSQREQEDLEHRFLKMQLKSDKSDFTTHNTTLLYSAYTDQTDCKKVIAKKNQEISPDLALKISLILETRTPQQKGLHKTILPQSSSKETKNQLSLNKNKTFTDLNTPRALVRSPLTCAYTHEVCQLCYGWSMAQGSLVSLGEAVGVIAGQSIGEPGTQLTMRTFHTGGVFSGDLLQEIRAPHSGKVLFPKALQGLLIRTSQGKIAFLIKISGELLVENSDRDNQIAPKTTHWDTKTATKISLAPSTILFVRQGETVKSNQILAELAITSEEGNQPIKSRQTLFSEINGRIMQWKSMTSRMHRTKGISLQTNKNGVMQNIVSQRVPRLKTEQTFENKQTPEVITKKVTTSIQTKPGVAVFTRTGKIRTEQAYLGPSNVTKNALYSVLDRSLMNSLGSTSLNPNNQAFSESGKQHYEEMRDLDDSALKDTVLAKKHGFGSIEPPKALTLGLLGVIATRVGASTRTCAKITRPDLATLSSNIKITAINQITLGSVTVNPYGVSLCSTKDSNRLQIQKRFTPPLFLSSLLQYYRHKESKQNLIGLHRANVFKEAGVHFLNTIAEEGDLVDENYTTIELYKPVV